MSLIHSLTKNHLGVHYLSGTGLGVKVRERKTRGRKLALIELRVYSRSQTFKNHYK